MIVQKDLRLLCSILAIMTFCLCSMFGLPAMENLKKQLCCGQGSWANPEVRERRPERFVGYGEYVWIYRAEEDCWMPK